MIPANYDAEVFNWAQQFAAQNSMRALADLAKYSRPAISLYLSGKYNAGAGALEAAIRPLMTLRNCPFLAREITAKDCTTRQNRPRPHASQGAMFEHWQACQACVHKAQAVQEGA